MSNKSKPIDAWLTLATAALGLMAYLFAKTPFVVVTFVIIMFGLLIHPVWNFWWIEKRTWRRLAALFVVAVAVVLIGIAAWPEPAATPVQAPAPSLFSRLTKKAFLIFNRVRGWPWSWMAFSALIGVAFGERFTRWRLDRRPCAYEWVHQKANEDRESIQKLVRIPGIGYQPCFDPEDPYLDFIVSVFNGSLFDVVVNNTLGTSYIFNNTDSKKFHYPARIESDEPIPIPSRRDNFFVVRQPLRLEEISAFKDKQKVLTLGSLEITFQGKGLPETQLDTNHVIETQKGGWRAWDQIGFICSYSPERWAELQASNIARAGELQQLRAKLEDKDAELADKGAAPLAAPNIIIYSPYFTWIGKETQVGKYVKIGPDFDRYLDIRQAAFLDFYLQPTPGTIGTAVDISATIVFEG